MKTRDTFAKRKEAAEAARARLVEKFKTRPAADDPAVVARAEERRAIAEARAERAAIRRAEEEKRQEEARERAAAEERARAEERAAQEAAERAAAAERERAEQDRLARVLADEAERKAKRDARYAARKQRVASS
ncbi:DUF6481 family protein [Propylenella binzhouense]|uniref:Uncharacterized protein n=1 Tax=Propylenella binzhouense TaxID=2555902 RepID=A0A964T306_9HYPH|nr:DUF6481 family protein [Propylenella binzhouense]MYZ47012.1 hypothetical protein [Propylenella binzhouense]